MANMNTRTAEMTERRISKEQLLLLAAILAACLVCVAAILPATAQSAYSGQTPHREVILEQTLGSGKAGQKLTAMLLEYPPGAASPAHQHPADVFAYVLDGEISLS
jgi:hypothetical protein